ncbi:probable tyrosyl-DNA phosphodiesterase [Hylaeus volcanicus]|uniref:probable tyrosyl-DNA phosphodiesterase n=1 Tax=Hylaeus volcanicus TaxID=313075 RepID=UPI0023B88088|nr:probable tyrosyl-DNA phosphodiesterase [Hylaeus volcanicus]
MASSSSSNDGLVKKLCPYMEKCYRKNPIHFKEMSHPHLEKIVVNYLETKIPDDLDFECSDRSLLKDQLNVLRMVMIKERNSGTSSLSTVAKVPDSEVVVTYCSILSKDNVVTQNLKDKVERHKQIMTERRENKLKGMDEQAEALSRCCTSNVKNNIDNSKVYTMRQELDSLKITEGGMGGDNSLQGTKRNNSFNTDESERKRSKSSNSEYRDNVKESTQSTDINSSSGQSSSSSKQSLIEIFQSCKSAKAKDEIRHKVINMMKQQGLRVSVVEPGYFDIKYALSAPYHIFFTRIQKSKATYDQRYSITFPEILDRSLGEIVSSLQINFMVDVGWLCLQYLLAGQSTDMMILFGERVDTEKVGLNITMIPVEIPTRFGCHHTKVMILKYKDDGIRVVVSTANLYMDDWENRTQGLWISPHLPPLPESANTTDGESPTGFKKDLERYLSKYRQPVLTEWICAIRRADFSAVNVFFLASVPGSHKDMDYNSWGHRKLATVLSKHATLPPDAPQWPIIAQSSSIGSLGPNYESWLLKEIVPSMSRETTSGLKSHPNFQFIYPSINNYKQSFDCQVGSCCLPYSLQTHSKQEWVESYLYQWKATHSARDKAMPHIKSYTRLSPDFKRIPWFVLTSANLSKAAWGTARNSHYIMSYEAGVIFIPKFIIKGSTTFPIKEEEAGVPVFPIPYDRPLTKYEPGDKPFVMDIFDGRD